MTNTYITATLEELRDAYFADTAYQDERQKGQANAVATMPQLQAILQDFVQERTNLQTMRGQLSTILISSRAWPTQSNFLIEINKMAKNHDEHAPIAERMLRQTLNGISGQNLGQRIEQFYTFVLEEQKRLRREGKTVNMAMIPRNAALLISLFALWLNPTNLPLLIYYASTCEGIYELIVAGYLPRPAGIALDDHARVALVRNHAEHEACQEAMRGLSTIGSDAFTLDSFTYWVAPRLKPKKRPVNRVVKEVDNTQILSPTPPQNEQSQEPAISASTEGETQSAHLTPLPILPLQPIEKLLLAERMSGIQQHILVDASVVRRIYHALLAGHVILTGPPGTGKTELARLLPKILWRDEESAEQEIDGEQPPTVSRPSGYTTRLVTATDEWSVRTLVGGIAPQSKNGAVSYSIQYGYLTTTILNNWSADVSQPEEWSSLRRAPITIQSSREQNSQRTFKGQWLVIDEFNRAPIDLALGEALTALGGNSVLRVPIEGGSAELPIPPDFRIIGTLNSFDRSYLNQISEALKRRFTFVEMLPPTREQRVAEQGIVLYKALKQIAHLSKAISVEGETLSWGDSIGVEMDATTGLYTITRMEEQHPFHEAFEATWQIFEVIRIYRQLGTAQAISLVQHLLIEGILQEYTTQKAWIEQALDAALCDTIADQLQVLLPDEIEVLLLYLTREHATFGETYNQLLSRLPSGRVYGQLLALGSVSTVDGQTFLSDTEIEQIANQNQPQVPSTKLTELFHLTHPGVWLPQFTRRLRTFKAERGL